MSMKSELAGLSILIIDTNTFLADVTRQALKAAGANKVLTETHTDAVLDRLRCDPPDVILLSLNFEDGATAKGIASLIRCGRTGAKPGIPLIVIGDDPHRTIVEKARDMGVHAFVVRPFCATQLASHVVSATHDRRQFVKHRGYIGPDRRLDAAGERPHPHRRAKDAPLAATEQTTLDA